MRLCLPLLLLLLGCGPRSAPPPGFPLRDVAGVEHRPFTEPDTRAVALLFVLPDCPVANAYAPEVNRLIAEYGPRGVRFFVVQVDPEVTDVEAAKHARAYGYTCPVVVDRGHELVRRAGATMVPEVAVFAADGSRKYHGRIDDLYADLGKRRARASSHDLRDALDAVLAGRPVARPETEAVGCDIPPLSPKEPPP